MAGGPTVADEFKASTGSATRLMNRIQQIREGASGQTSNSINPEVPDWVRNGAASIGNNSPSVSTGVPSVAGLGATATAIEEDAAGFREEAAAKKLAAVQAASNAKAQADLIKKLKNTDMGGSGGSINTGGNPGIGGSASGKRGDVINAAKDLLGMDYVYGGGHGAKAGPSRSSLAKGSKTYGIDCSGLVRYAFAKAGLGKWGGQAVSQTQSTYGQYRPLNKLLPGDLVIKGQRGSAGHIAIYLGKGMILEAQQTGTKVHIRSIGNGQGFSGIHLDY